MHKITFSHHLPTRQLAFISCIHFRFRARKKNKQTDIIVVYINIAPCNATLLLNLERGITRRHLGG